MEIYFDSKYKMTDLGFGRLDDLLCVAKRDGADKSEMERRIKAFFRLNAAQLKKFSRRNLSL